MEVDEDEDVKAKDNVESSISEDRVEEPSKQQESNHSEDSNEDNAPQEEELKEQRSFPYLNEERQADTRHDQMQMGLHQVAPQDIQASTQKHQASASSISGVEVEEEEEEVKPVS